MRFLLLYFSLIWMNTWFTTPVPATPAGTGKGVTAFPVSIHPALAGPVALASNSTALLSSIRESIRLENDLIAISINQASGIIEEVTNKVTGTCTSLSSDQAGLNLTLTDPATGTKVLSEWKLAPDISHAFQANTETQNGNVSLHLIERTHRYEASVIYELGARAFWIERSLIISPSVPSATFETILYGTLEVDKALKHVLDLGKFDHPCLVRSPQGDLFAGVGWWFYEVDDKGSFFNNDARFPIQGAFRSAPWYLGIFREEPGDPYPGWLWYKTFLELRKALHDSQRTWSYWNLGWGQWGIDLDHASPEPYFQLASRLGIRSLALGSGGAGKGVDEYIRLLSEDETSRLNRTRMAELGLRFGFLFPGVGWDTQKDLENKIAQLNSLYDAGVRAIHFDFFSSPDTFLSHRIVAEFITAARQRMDYTECHLGMAAYGPQLQREVLINHPDDIGDFDISGFSVDWATLMAFRLSRAHWQARYDNLIPEYGLYYFITHYANWGHPRRMTDPEPQQFLYSVHAYTGIGFNFHDVFGFRSTLMGTAAFSPFLVFGHLDPNMPEVDAEFAKKCLIWISNNSESLRPGRICFENHEVCVMSKVVSGKGLLFILSYTGQNQFLQLDFNPCLTQTPNTIRVIYPTAGSIQQLDKNAKLQIRIPGESVMVLDLNQSVSEIPPQSIDQTRLEASNCILDGTGYQTLLTIPPTFIIPSSTMDNTLPSRLLSLDNVGNRYPELLDLVEKQPGEEPVSTVDWLGKGSLPQVYRKAYGFAADHTIETWKIAPWAFADRAWLTYRPCKPIPLTAPQPCLQVSGEEVKLWPRIDYRSKLDEWSVPLYYADVTGWLRPGNQLKIMLWHGGEYPPGHLQILTSPLETSNDRKGK